MKTRIIRAFRRLRVFSINWEKVKNRADLFFQMSWRAGLLLLLLGVVVFVVKGLRNDAYTIKALQVPLSFTEAGISGAVLSRKLIDELHHIEDFAASVKEGPLNTIQSEVGKPDLNVEVMGIGLTLNSLTYHLGDLLGLKNRVIGGELSDIDRQLSFTLRMTDNVPKTFSQSYEEGGRTDALQYLLHEAAKQVIQNLDPYRISVYYYHKDDTEKCLEVIGEILKTRPEETKWAYLAWGNMLNRQGKVEEAIEKFELASAHDPSFELARMNRGWAEVEAGKYEKAIKTFKELTKLEPEKGVYWNAIAICYRNLDQRASAEKAHAKAIAVEPGTLWWYTNWAFYKYQLEDTTGIRQIYKDLKDHIDLKGADYYQVDANFSLFLGDFATSTKQLETLLDLDPSNIAALQNLARIYFDNTKDFAAVKKVTRRLIAVADQQNDVQPKHFRQTYYNYMAMAEYNLQEYDSALVHAHMAIREDEDSSAPYTTLAETHAFMGNDEAFYENIEIALVKGFKTLRQFLDEAPYNRYAEVDRFQKLLDKYYGP